MTPTFRDIPQRTREASYGVDISWSDLEESIARYTKNYQLDLCPDFQRGHVWTPAQRVAYVEAKLSNGIPHGTDFVRFNMPGWQGSFEGQMVCVDGLQRLTTALMFLRDEVPISPFRDGKTYLRSEIGGRLSDDISFRLMINNLKSRADVLRWYCELNGSGTPHSPEEIARVKALWEAELRCEDSGPR